MREVALREERGSGGIRPCWVGRSRRTQAQVEGVLCVMECWVVGDRAGGVGAEGRRGSRRIVVRWGHVQYGELRNSVRNVSEDRRISCERFCGRWG